ncbi:hypothetical protein LCGC14_2418820 [marine sediment metagenome]|uniref:Uncharacterized protein n=1 Tax=marine sediment metagenome TaxID=412755 RepID=A0A0F9BQA0_9ZZZZ
MKYYKFLHKGTYCTLHMKTELPPPGDPSPPIPNIQPSGSSGAGSGIGYHAYTKDILPYVAGDDYNKADLWIVQTHGHTISYHLAHDKLASVLPPHPMKCVVAESIELIEKVPFIVKDGRLYLL